MTISTQPSADAALVGQPITFHNSGLTAPTRILKSAMTERLCDWSDDPDKSDGRGKPNAEYAKLYEEWGKAGLGMIVFGNLPVDRRYPEARGNPIIDRTSTWDPVAAFAPIFTKAKADGAIILVQISHGGRQCDNTICVEPVSSSNVQTPGFGGMVFNKPRPMTIEEIDDLVDRFAFTSKAIYDAGANGVQLHAAHGYLLSQYLSPNVNLRTDKYGGSLENRMRIVLEIVAAIRERVPDKAFMISIKINSADFSKGGFSEEESRQTIKKLEEAGLDLIELSGGTYDSLSKSGGFAGLTASSAKREAFFLEFADSIRPHLVTAKLCVTGGFRSVTGMASALGEKSCDMIGVARPLTAEVNFPKMIILGEIERARESRMLNSLTTPAAIIQMKQIATGQEVSDFSKDEVVEKTIADIVASGVRTMSVSKV